MQKIITTFTVLLFLLLTGFKPNGNTTLKVEVSNFENKASTKIWVSVFSEKDFLEKSIQTQSVIISGSKVIVEFDLPPGEYAVSTYQDVNSNGKLDRYFIGKPKEPYGFSNNVKPFGPPSYKDCKFNLTSAPKLISISLIN
ncbi:Uncharacterized conserved protein, DUF2141 family [Cyclobacterium xiamenense]|uniref:Uncharacterized conserved protein, DUF2141 family n=1 Tax=Cyclobacterium xiamenense TaxID=1297121 RepID=A0A1H7ABS6_9BACT|nr:DUF2141 domain-containing protein [Cyclobacterium xiamenense]SEJ63093.1 Uncharacterized conserved protein, DUF2141 family [Cyclobacterium xiamenense]